MEQSTRRGVAHLGGDLSAGIHGRVGHGGGVRGCVARGCGGAGGRAEQCQDGFARASGNSRGAAGPLIEPGGGARAAPRRAPLAARAAAAGRPLAAAQTMGHGRLKEPASAATAAMSCTWSQRGGRRGEQRHAPPRAASAPAASAPPLPPCEAAGGSEGGCSCRACGEPRGNNKSLK